MTPTGAVLCAGSAGALRFQCGDRDGEHHDGDHDGRQHGNADAVRLARTLVAFALGRRFVHRATVARSTLASDSSVDERRNTLDAIRETGVMLGAVGFTRAELESFAGTTVPDLVGPGLRLLFVGINPGLWTAATKTHFAHPGNRFYPALLLGGVIDRPIDRGSGFTDDDRDDLIRRGIGITNLAKRATARASELTADELERGGEELHTFVRQHQPRVVAIAGITAYRIAFGRAKVALGEQPQGFEGARLWIVPNPSGLNAHETIESLAAAYREPAMAAGVVT
jgi:double-stranded uracil-DNA glycosylase